MKSILILIALSLSLLNYIFSQSTVTISGYMTDSLTGERLIGANVYNPLDAMGNSTNNFGFYTIKTNNEEIIKLSFSYVGYCTKNIAFFINGDTTVNVALNSNNSIQQITVIGAKAREDLAEISKITLKPAQINKIPSITGEPDLLKVFQLMPGVNQGIEGTSGIYVRGGSPDQNLFLLDDVPLYNVMHLGGLYSVFDPSAIKSVDLYKGGFPAHYGGRISSIVDIRNNDGNLHQFKGEIGLSLLLSKIYFEGPLVKKKSSFIISVRRSNLDLFTNLYNKGLTNSTSNIGYYFYDINTKVNYILNDNSRVFLSFYKGMDNFYNQEKESNYGSGFSYDGKSSLNWGNTTASVRWQHIFPNRITNNLTLAYTRYKYANENSYKAYNEEQNQSQASDYSLNSNINDFILKSDFQIPLFNNDIKIGAEFTRHFFTPTAIHYSYSFEDSVITSPKTPDAIPAYSSAIYAGKVFNLSHKISANIGLRLGAFFVEDTTFLVLEPRFIFNYKFIPSWALKASYCHMSQNIHLLTSSGSGLPSDLWVPSTKQIHPESSKQLTLGISHTTSKNYQLSAEVYYKTLSNLIEYKEGVLIYSTGENWENKVEKQGKGSAKGIELMVEKQSGKATGWISYTLSKSDRSFANLQDGTPFPFKYDQLHNISVVLNYTVSTKLSASFIWQYHTGAALTIAEGKYELQTENFYNYGNQQLEEIHIYSKRNAYRMPSYHKLDLGLNYTKTKKRGTAIWNLGLYNVYNRQNAYFLFFKEVNGKTKLYQQSLFPIIFNFGYTFKF